MFVEELSDLKDRYPERLQVLHVLSREEQESELLSGRLDGDRLRQLAAAGLLPVDEVDEWYLCGPFGMVTAARETLRRARRRARRACTSSCSTPTRRRPARRGRGRRRTRRP